MAMQFPAQIAPFPFHNNRRTDSQRTNKDINFLIGLMWCIRGRIFHRSPGPWGHHYLPFSPGRHIRRLRSQRKRLGM